MECSEERTGWKWGQGHRFDYLISGKLCSISQPQTRLLTQASSVGGNKEHWDHNDICIIRNVNLFALLKSSSSMCLVDGRLAASSLHNSILRLSLMSGIILVASGIIHTLKKESILAWCFPNIHVVTSHCGKSLPLLCGDPDTSRTLVLWSLFVFHTSWPGVFSLLPVTFAVINALSQRYFLQANDQKDLKDWVEALNHASKITVSMIPFPFWRGSVSLPSMWPVWVRKNSDGSRDFLRSLFPIQFPYLF